MKLYSLIFSVFLLTSFAYSQGGLKEGLDDVIKESDKFLQKRDYKNALESANRALKIGLSDYGDTSAQVATVYSKIGRIYFTKGELDEAEKYFLKEKNVLGENKFSPAYARLINNLSVVYQSMGKGEKVEKMLIESIDIKKQLGFTIDTSYAKTLNNLGQYYYSIGRYPEAEKYLVESLEIKKKANPEENISNVNTLINLGLMYKAIGNRDLTVKNLEEAYKISSRILAHDDPTYALVVFNLAIAYTEYGMQEKAEPLITKSNEIQKSLSGELNIGSINTLYNIAQLQISTKKYNEAIKILEPLEPKVLAKLGNAHPLYSKILKALGIVYWIQGNVRQAYKYLEETVQLAKTLYEPTSINYANALHSFGGILKEMKEYPEAENYYQNAFQIYLYQIDKFFPYYSEAEKSKFYAILKERFDMYYCYTADRRDENPELLTKMYDLHTSTKGLLLNFSKKLKKNVLRSGDKILIKKYEEWIERKEYLSKLYSMSKMDLKKTGKNVEQLEKEANDIEKELSKAASQNSTILDTMKVSWKDVQKKLGPDDAAIEIIRFKFFNKGWSDSVYYAAIIITSETKDKPMYVLMQNGNDMEKSFYLNYKNMIKQKFPDKKSYSAYWEEIEKLIPNKKRILLSLDGIYNNINLNTLKRENGTFVLEDKDVVIIPNTNEIVKEEIRNQIEQVTYKNTASLIGFPKYKLDKTSTPVLKDFDKAEVSHNEILINELPGTKVELGKISEDLAKNKWQFKTLMEEEASEAKFKNLENSQLIHIATHGFFLSNLTNAEEGREFGVDIDRAVQNPLLRSGLLFSGASNYLNFDFTSQEKDENGILTSYEAMNLNFDNTKLIVMSACETGLGQVMNGEGVYGLQRSFQVAGAKNLIMSLWTVNDQTTQELMTGFYSKWLSGISIRTAFREAQLELKNKYKDPYYWGAFVLVGEIK